MLSVDEALDRILETVSPLPPMPVPLGDALGLPLCEDVFATEDSPPFDKSLMDGFAVRSEDVSTGKATLRVVETITAGTMPSREVGPGEATRIMTGAPLPPGADAVVKIEDTRFDEATQQVAIDGPAITPGTAVITRGTNTAAGDLVLSKGRVLRPQEIGTLAELGRATISVGRRPRVAILATGDELVPVEDTPGPGRIRNSNEPMLVAQVRRAGAEPVALGIARDDRTELRDRIRRGLEADVLLLSGGVSMGTMDLVPAELEAAGVTPVFHKVNVKPGKPLWFGYRDGEEAKRTFVFGLPGNPVSSMVCFELFTRPAIRKLMHVDSPEAERVPATLVVSQRARGDRPVYFPARLERGPSGPIARLSNWHGSSDLRATVDANGMAVLPAGDDPLPEGTVVEFIPWD